MSCMEDIKGAVDVDYGGAWCCRLALTELYQPPAGGQEAGHTCRTHTQSQQCPVVVSSSKLQVLWQSRSFWWWAGG
jgi:hypothetical protein